MKRILATLLIFGFLINAAPASAKPIAWRENPEDTIAGFFEEQGFDDQDFFERFGEYILEHAGDFCELQSADLVLPALQNIPHVREHLPALTAVFEENGVEFDEAMLEIAKARLCVTQAPVCPR